MQSKDFDEVLERLKKDDYEIKQGKYLAVKPKYGSQYIRVKSLGEDYSEQALRNRIIHKGRYENENQNKIKNGAQDTIEVSIYKTVRHYTLVFAADVLPMKKINPKKPFTWTNDAELDKLTALNKKINKGISLTVLRNNFEHQEKVIAEKEKAITHLKDELKFFINLYEKGNLYYENPSATASEKENAMKLLSEHKITSENYKRIQELITANENEIKELGENLTGEYEKMKEVSDLLGSAEKIVGGTYVQSLVDEEKERRQSEYILNGLKKA